MFASARFRSPLRLLLWALIPAGICLTQPALAQPPQPEPYCWAVADSGDTLVSMDKDGSDFVSIGSTGTSLMEAIAFEPATGTLYAADAGRFGTLNTGTGSFTQISAAIGSCTLPASQGGGSVTINDVDSLMFDFLTGVLWAVERDGGSSAEVLFQIVPGTGLVDTTPTPAFIEGATCVQVNGAGLLGDVDDIGVSPIDSTLYAVNNNGGTNDQLITITPTSGAATIVATFTNAVGGGAVFDMEGMSYGLDGTLYGTTGNAGGGNSDNLWVIDEATAVATSMGPFGSGSDYEAVACLTDNAITGTVFYDVDEDGVEDPSEVGVEGVTVNLYVDNNNDGVVDGGDTLIDTTTTDANGDYYFEAAQGNYVLETDVSTHPMGASLTTDNVEEADFANTDFGMTDPDNDYGLILPTALTITKTSSPAGGQAVPGGVITYTLIPRSDSPEVLTNVQVTDSIPANTSFVSASPAQNSGPDPLVWDIGSVTADVPGSVTGTSGSTSLVAIKDTWIDENSPDNNEGDDNEVKIKDDGSDDRRALFEWDLSTIPSGAIITNATMRFFVNGDRSGVTISVHRLTQEWAEGTGDNNFDADWDHWDEGGATPPADEWATGGGDFNATVYGTFDPDTQDVYEDVDVQTLVQGWVDGSFANEGVILLSDSSDEVKLRVRTEAGEEPLLEIDYVTPSTTTELGAAGVVRSDGDSITVTMTLESDQSDTNVTPGTLNVSGAGGAGAACGAASPASQSITAGVPITFTWSCTVSAGAAQGGSVTFDADAAGDVTTYATATSNSVLVSPPLTFDVQIDLPLSTAVTQITNTATVTSEQTRPADDTVMDPVVFSSIGDTVWEDLDQDGVEDGPELGVSGVRVWLDIDGDRMFNASIDVETTTDGSGQYLFDGLGPGTFTVFVDETTVPAGWTQTGDPDEVGPCAVCDAESTVVLAAGEDLTTTDFGYWDGVSVPVSLAGFRSTTGRHGTLVEWTTATEAGNAGFFLHAVTATGWERVNPTLIASKAVHSTSPLTYSVELPVQGAKAFYLEDVDVRGHSQLHGPFFFGNEYGGSRRSSLADAGRTDWQTIRAEHEAKSAARLAARSTRGVRGRSSSSTAFARRSIDLLVDRDGIYRVAYEAIREAGVDLSGARASSLSLRSQGQAVPLRVLGGPQFGPGSALEFYGRGLDTLYTKTAVYTLSTGRRWRQRIGADPSAPPAGGVEPYYMETTAFERNRKYGFGAPGDDPWYDTDLLANGRPATASFDLAIDGYLAGRAPVELRLETWGTTSWPQSPDHHLEVELNGAQLADEYFDGQTLHPIELRVPDRVLREGGNELVLRAPGDTGVPWDIVSFDRFELTFPRQFAARDGRLEFESSGRAFEIDGLESRRVVAYRIDPGGVTRLTGVRVTTGIDGFRARIPGSGSAATYVVSTESQLLSPALRRRPAQSGGIRRGAADYLMIAHPDFLDGLDDLVARRESQGLRVKVVDVRKVYVAFGDGSVSADAIQRYVRFAARRLGVKSVLLVGGDTYDYHDYLGLGAVSFIPSPYRTTHPVVRFAPVDPLYADVDGDEVPDLGIGRLPVRTSAELETVIAKTLDYERKSFGRTAVFAADASDGAGGPTFSAASERFAATLGSGWAVKRAYIDDLGTEAARKALLEGINEGAALTSFFGHSGPSVWTFDGLFSGSDAAALSNHRMPTVVTQWGCWNTYYVSPYYDSLGHELMLSGDRGAAAVLGASGLTLARSDRMLGERFMPKAATPGMTLGEALTRAKQEVAKERPELVDVILGWTLLGDPQLSVEPR